MRWSCICRGAQKCRCTMLHRGAVFIASTTMGSSIYTARLGMWRPEDMCSSVAVRWGSEYFCDSPCFASALMTWVIFPNPYFFMAKKCYLCIGRNHCMCAAQCTRCASKYLERRHVSLACWRCWKIRRCVVLCDCNSLRQTRCPCLQKHVQCVSKWEKIPCNDGTNRSGTMRSWVFWAPWNGIASHFHRCVCCWRGDTKEYQ